MDETTEEIRRRADIVDIISQYVALRPAGAGKWKACCPFHDEKTPSFNVSRERGFYKCFGCGVSGDLFKFVQEIENISFYEAKKQLAEKYGVALGSKRDITPQQQAVYDERDRLLKINAATTAFFRVQFGGNKGLPARDYARGRGLSSSTLDRFGIGYAPDSWDALQHELLNKYGFKPDDCARAGVLVEKESVNEQTGETYTRYYDRYRHRLMFPIWDAQGRVIAFGGRVLEGAQCGASDAKYINSSDGPLFSKSNILYGWHIARPEVGRRENVIICEGYMDAIALHEAGFGQTMATLGTAMTEQHVRLLARLAPKVVYLCFDGDGAGIRAALRSSLLFKKHDFQVRVVVLPGKDDPDSFIRKQGAVGFERELRKAPLWTRYRVEMSLRDFDLSIFTERIQAIEAAASTIAELESDAERASLNDWLANQWAIAEGITDGSQVRVLQSRVREIVSKGRTNLLKKTAASHQSHSGIAHSTQTAVSSAQQNDSLVSVDKLQGVVKAERMLLSTLLGAPSWRSRILEKIPMGRWTREEHSEIAETLRQYDSNKPIDAGTLIQSLSPAAADLMSELMMSDEAQFVLSDKVVDDLVARLEKHHARKVEQEVLEMTRLRMEKGSLSKEEYKIFQERVDEANIATRRKRAPEV